jgi:hypothetical protein
MRLYAHSMRLYAHSMRLYAHLLLVRVSNCIHGLFGEENRRIKRSTRAQACIGNTANHTRVTEQGRAAAGHNLKLQNPVAFSQQQRQQQLNTSESTVVSPLRLDAEQSFF